MGRTVIGRSVFVICRYSMIDSALASRLSPLILTSLLLPVLPEVVSRSRSSGATAGSFPSAAVLYRT